MDLNVSPGLIPFNVLSVAIWGSICVHWRVHGIDFFCMVAKFGRNPVVIKYARIKGEIHKTNAILAGCIVVFRIGAVRGSLFL